MADNELENLSDLLNSEGWRWFSEHVTKEWGPSGLRYQQAVKAAAQDSNAVVELQKVLYAQEQVLVLMKAPRERLENLKHGHEVALRGPSMSRRGPGL